MGGGSLIVIMTVFSKNSLKVLPLKRHVIRACKVNERYQISAHRVHKKVAFRSAVLAHSYASDAMKLLIALVVFIAYCRGRSDAYPHPSATFSTPVILPMSTDGYVHFV